MKYLYTVINLSGTVNISYAFVKFLAFGFCPACPLVVVPILQAFSAHLLYSQYLFVSE